MRRRIYRRILVAGAAAAVVGLCTWRMFFAPAAPKEGTGPPVAPLPPIADSPYLNTKPTAGYVGSAACAVCHPDEHRSYMRTEHSRAFSRVDATLDLPQAEFEHTASGRSYRILRRGQGAGLLHQELLGSLDGPSELLAEHEIRYAIGSGHHWRTFLAESDGFLFESPVSWYSLKNEWSMSPGYDDARQPGFGRGIGFGCLYCHAGRVEAAENSVSRVKVHEFAIGCERCHGPGSIHVELRRNPGAVIDGPDPSIVHPDRLSRRLKEAICADCHLFSQSFFPLRGRRFDEFRPGLRLSDFRVDFGLESENTEMTVSGHVEQMRMSRCYQESETMTCTSCHDPHSTPRPAELVSYYKAKCLKCHDEQSCGLPPDHADRRQRENNCLTCHMPRVPSSKTIPHLAFTHHRIGIHRGRSETERKQTNGAGKLIALSDTSHLSPLDRNLCLGLAYLETSRLENDPQAFETYRRRARRLLEGVAAQGLNDASVAASLAYIYNHYRQFDRAIESAARAVASQSLSASQRANSLFVLGSLHLHSGRPQAALPHLNELVRLRRRSQDWAVLGLCRKQAGDVSGGLIALRQAARIGPERADVQRELAHTYEEQGDSRRADEHRRRAERLSALHGRAR